MLISCVDDLLSITHATIVLHCQRFEKVQVAVSIFTFTDIIYNGCVYRLRLSSSLLIDLLLRISMELPPEILECIFYQLAPIGFQPYVGDVNQALRACFSVSKFVRGLAMMRIFRSLNIDSSISPGRLELLLSILEPPSPFSWMSVRRFIQHFVFHIFPLERKPTDWALTHPFKADDIVPLFLSLSRGNEEHSQLSSFVFTVAPFDFPLFTQQFEDVVLDFMKLPSLRSLEIHGRFFSRDFLPDTHINNLYITGHGLDLDPLSHEVNSTSAFGFPLPPPRGDSIALPTYPDLRTLKTDLTWPRDIEDKKFDLIFQNLTSLVVNIRTPLAFSNAEAVIPKIKSLRNLTIMYDFDCEPQHRFLYLIFVSNIRFRRL